MSQVVHIQTTVHTVFGLLDGDGNAVPQEPIVAQCPRFDPKGFAEAHEAIRRRRDEIIAATDAQTKTKKDAAV